MVSAQVGEDSRSAPCQPQYFHLLKINENIELYIGGPKKGDPHLVIEKLDRTLGQKGTKHIVIHSL